MKKKSIQVSITADGKTHELSGETLAEIFEGLPQLDPSTKVKFLITRGDNQREIVLTIPNFRKLTWPGLTGEVARAGFVKRLSL